MTKVIVEKELNSVVVTEHSSNIEIVQESASVIISSVGLQGPMGPQREEDVGVLYLKNNAITTPISAINSRAVVSGDMQTGELFNFIKDPSTNSLKYNGSGGRFYIIATFNFYANSQNICGFYIGHNTDPSSPLDPNADRISESEIYANASTPANQPQATAIQTVLPLNLGDRIFFIVQNQSAASSIRVEFLKLVVRA
jgi:hypothetical protein